MSSGCERSQGGIGQSMDRTDVVIDEVIDIVRVSIDRALIERGERIDPKLPIK